MVFLSPKIDLVFKKLFGTPANKGILIAFLNSILNRKNGRLITEVKFSDTNNNLKILEQKLSIVDVRCTDQQGNNYIVELQVKNHHDFAQRAQYYGACGLDIQLQPSEKYYSLMPVIFVGVVDFVLFKRHKRYLTHHYFADDNDHACDLNLLEFHFIELPKFKKTLKQLASLDDKWIYFLKNAENEAEVPAELKNEKPLRAAFHVLTQSAWTKDELLLYERQLDAARVDASSLDTAKSEGFAKGHAKGRVEEREEMVCSMLAEGIDLATIAKITKFSVETIKKLKKG